MANPRHNELLVQLPDAIYQRLLPHLQLVSLLAGEQLHGPGESIAKVHFPVTAVVCLSRQLRDGLCMDVAQIGSEGMVGLRGLVGRSVHRAYVGITGLAYQLDMAVLKRELEEHLALGMMCMRFGNHITRMVSTEGACAHFHAIEQRLAKWILMRHDRGHPASIDVTQRTIANALGVRREAVSLAMARLQGLTFMRGRIKVLDRSLLEKNCCECYQSLKDMLEQQSEPFSVSQQAV